MQYIEIQNLDSLTKHPAVVSARGRMHPAEPPGTPRRNPVRPQQTHADKAPDATFMSKRPLFR